jgi:hypothetical protein
MNVTMADAKTWARRAGIVVAAILAVVGLGNLIRFFVSSPPKFLDGRNSVATEWNNSVRRLGVNPIYPPQEDLYVGDIFAVVKSSDDNYNRMDEVFGDHAIKLWHVDMTDALKKTYASVPIFPATNPHPAHDDDIWEQRESNDLFAPGARKTLSLVAFPAFTIHNSRSATARGSTGQGMFGWLSGVFGISRDDEEMEQLSFPAPETYGVDAIDAQVALFGFCNNERTGSFCTDRAVRNMLSMVVGDEIWRPKIDPKSQQRTGYATEVELMLVKQVFLTRSIVQVRSADSASGAAARLVAKLKNAADQPTTADAGKASGVTGGSASNLPAASPPQGGAAADAADAQRKKLIQVRDLLDSASQTEPGGSISALSTDGTMIALKQVYPRPLAIGFRAVSQQPVSNTDGDSSKVADQK